MIREKKFKVTKQGLLVLVFVIFIVQVTRIINFSKTVDEISIIEDKPGISKDNWNKIWETANLLPTQLRNDLRTPFNVTRSDKFWKDFWPNVELTENGIGPNFLNVRELFNQFPAPTSRKTIQIYNEKAYNELVSIFLTQQSTIRMCTVGGSSSAGSGYIGHDFVFFNQLKRFIEDMQLPVVGAEIEMINQGHGARGSLYAAVFAPNLVPPNTDVLMWEFAINDYGYRGINNRDEQARSIFLAWLHEVQKMYPKPPKVILVYLWKRPFNLDDNNQVINPVFQAHAHLAKEFDFVVGFVNLASYCDELQVNTTADLKKIFLADQHHPSKTGHSAIAFLVLNLLRGQGNWTIPPAIIDTNTTDATAVEKYKWLCGNDDEGNRFVKSQVNDEASPSGWKSPLRTASLEEPNIRQYVDTVGSRQLIFKVNSSEIKMIGKEDPLRLDRQQGVAIACCNTNHYQIPLDSNYTEVTIPNTADPMKNVSSLFLGFGEKDSDFDTMKVYIKSSEDKNVAEYVNGKVIRPKGWRCFWNWPNRYSTTWFAFKEEQLEVSSIYMCVESSKCQNEGQSGTILEVLAVY